MERLASDEERIKRAEEIYYRRKAQSVRGAGSSVNVTQEKRVSLGKKMTIKVCVCVLIYIAIQICGGYSNEFGQNVKVQINRVLCDDTDFQQLYYEFMEYFIQSFNNNNNIDDAKEDSNISNEDNTQLDESENGSSEGGTNSNMVDKSLQESEQVNNNQNEDASENNNNNGAEIKGEENKASVSNVEENVTLNDGTQKARLDSENVGQMEKDAEYIKQNCNLVKPIEGRITSGFGEREQTEIISAFHQGVDISATTGTPIYASMEGTVVASSFAGEYGNHIKIQNGEILTVYAHCSELEVKVGDYITQRQEIGKVGATGKVTGAHLHFEIRRNGRYVNPELILDF